MDRQTAMVKPVYLHNFVSGGIQTYFQCGEIVEKWPPWRSKFYGGSHFFTTFGSKFNVKIWPVSAFNVKKWPGESLFTLKNDPGSHFSTGSLFNVTPPPFSFKWSFSLRTHIPRMDAMLDFICMAPVDLSGARRKRQNTKWNFLPTERLELLTLRFQVWCSTDWDRRACWMLSIQGHCG